MAATACTSQLGASFIAASASRYANGGTGGKSDSDQRVGRTLWTASSLSPFFSPEKFSLTRGALHAEETRPFFLMPQEKGHSSLPMLATVVPLE